MSEQPKSAVTDDQSVADDKLRGAVAIGEEIGERPQLGINYGMGVPSLARGLNRHPLIASTIIERYRRRHARLCAWRENKVQTAMLERRIESTYGWPLHLTTSPNQRTLFNFPMQRRGR
jgi:hypothetical protein